MKFIQTFNNAILRFNFFIFKNMLTEKRIQFAFKSKSDSQKVVLDLVKKGTNIGIFFNTKNVR